MSDCYLSCVDECVDDIADYLYVSSSDGTSRINLKTLSKKEISENTFFQIEIDNNFFYGLDRSGIVRIDLSNKEQSVERLINNNQVRNFKTSRNFLWINLINRVRLLSLSTSQSWYYNESDGIQGGNIYNIGCEEDWVWFITADGVSMYNWSKYHDD